MARKNVMIEVTPMRWTIVIDMSLAVHIILFV